MKKLFISDGPVVYVQISGNFTIRRYHLCILSIQLVARKQFSQQFFSYKVAVIDDRVEHIADPSSCWYISDHRLKNFVSIKNVNISIILSNVMLVHLVREVFDSNIIRIINSDSP